MFPAHADRQMVIAVVPTAGGTTAGAGAGMLVGRVSWGRIFRSAVFRVLLDNTFGS